MPRAREVSAELKRLMKLNGVHSGRVEALGPEYPEMGASVAKFRKLAAKAGSVAAMSREERQAYGAAVEKAIRAKQRAALVGPAVVLEGPCRDVGAAIRGQHKAALMAYPAKVRAARTAAQWEAMYAAAMAEKRAGGRALSADGRKAAVKAFREARAENPVAATATTFSALDAAEKASAAARKAWATRRAKTAAKNNSNYSATPS